MSVSSSFNTGAMSMSPTAASSVGTASAMSGMHMGGNNCKISMLWNWYTVDACFLSSTWQVTSTGIFAGSCIGVVFLVISLEFLRRLQREYDTYIRHQSTYHRMREPQIEESGPLEASQANKRGSKTQTTGADISHNRGYSRNTTVTLASMSQQAVRASIHMVQFAVAYFIMLLAMYYNGYIIICIIIGAFLGAFIFSGDQIQGRDGGDTSDITGCCG